MGPDGDVGGKDNLKDAIVDFILGAKKSLRVAVQEIDCEEIAKALIEKRQEGVLVKVVLEGDYLRARRRRKYPWEPGGELEVNRQIQNALLRSNIDLKLDFNTDIFHQKFIVRDNRALLTGSTNFTETGVGRNLNHLIIVDNKKVAMQYYREFKEIQNGHFGKNVPDRDPAPETVKVSGVPIKVLFAPDHHPEMEMMKQMIRAKERIDFAIFTFSDSSGIDDTMLSLLDKGLTIKGSFYRTMGKMKWSPYKVLKSEGVDARLVGDKGPVRKLHHKIMVIDRQVIIAGSMNYSGPANALNDENIIIIGSLKETNQSVVDKQKKLAGYVLEELDRIHGDLGS
jgi:phosphatidylserine/phosphatidylglycerophosphate/cardiolipin synthase-like enzyme